MTSTISPIPIQNLYYLLCYAWRRLEEAEKIAIGELKSDSFLNLVAYILLRGTRHLLKRGFDRNYVAIADEAPRIKGRLDLVQSVRRNLLERGQAACEYDELSYDIPHNQILKASIRSLVRLPKSALDDDLRDGLQSLLRQLHDIKDVALSRSLFRSTHIHRNIQFYDFLLKICRLVFDNRTVLEAEGQDALPDFIRDEKQLQRLFEKFVYNFYAKHTDFTVRSERLEWLGSASSDDAERLLPTMQTDISLESPTRKIIVDTKFYKSALIRSEHGEMLHSGNLYQMFAYLKNPKPNDMVTQREGLLLYPTVEKELDLEYELSGHRLRVCTVDLNQEWRGIHSRLLEVVGSGSGKLIATSTS
jgi:5-methylcytosine-specific restriction enzyme subunit McrC